MTTSVITTQRSEEMARLTGKVALITGAAGVDRREAVDDRDKPGQGDPELFSGCCKQPTSLNRTAVSTRPGMDEVGLLRVHYLIESEH
jgi:hypothetical protein